MTVFGNACGTRLDGNGACFTDAGGYSAWRDESDSSLPRHRHSL